MSNIQCQDSWSHSQWPTSSALQLVLWQYYNAAEVSEELNQRGKNDVWHFGTCHYLKTHHASSRALSKGWWKTSRIPEHIATEWLLCCALGTLPPSSCHPSQLETPGRQCWGSRWWQPWPSGTHLPSVGSKATSTPYGSCAVMALWLWGNYSGGGSQPVRFSDKVNFPVRYVFSTSLGFLLWEPRCTTKPLPFW